MIRTCFGTVSLSFAMVTFLNGQSLLENILSPSRLPLLKNSKLVQISSHDTSGRNDDFLPIADGATATLANIPGPGVITNIWITISSPDKYFLRRILLRMYWDGEQSPSVEVPIGDFFGTGLMYKQYTTPFLGMSSGGYYSYFPMPFNRSARVEVVNQTGREVYSFYYHIDYHKLGEPLGSDVAYFHATWRREIRTDPKEYYTILDAAGEGHLVGINMSMQSYDGDMQYLEGDEMIFVDGEKRPSVAGTGTEDYFNSGWYFNRGEFAAPYHGLILKDDTLGRIAAYRFHILDAIPFKRSIRFMIEHGHANEQVADYSSTAYWYQKEPHKQLRPMVPPGLRIPLRAVVPNGALEAESLRPIGLSSEVEEMSGFGADWSGLKQLKVFATKEEDQFSIDIPALEDRYDIDLFYTKGPGYGNVAILQDGAKAAELRCYDKAVVPAGKISLKNLRAPRGKISLTFVSTGKEGKSSGYSIGLDAFVLSPHRKFVPEWYMIGPFPNPRDRSLQRLGLDTVFPPEREIDLGKAYIGDGGQQVSWTREATPPSGRVDLYKYDPYELVVVYALTYVYSPIDQTLPLLLGTDDGVKVFLNDNEIHRVLTIRIAQPDQDTVPMPLVRGWNKLLLKIENNFGGYNFYARVLDLEESLRFSAGKER